MKVVHLTTVHEPDDNRIFYKEAVSLKRAGCEVVVVAPGAEDYEEQGVRIKVVKEMQNRFQRLLMGGLSVLLLAWREEADLYHLHDPELIPWGIILRAKGKSVIYDAHEDVSAQITSKEWLPGWSRQFVGWMARLLERIACELLSGIVVSHPAIAERLSVDRQKYAVVRNYPRLEEFPEERVGVVESRGLNRYSGREVIANFGGISYRRATNVIVEAMSLMDVNGRCKMIVGGRIESNELYRELVKSREWSNVDFRGFVKRASMLDILYRARVAMVLYSRQPNHYQIRSNRLFESMAAGVPVIVPNFGEWGEFMRIHECGIAVDPTAPKEVADALTALVEDPKLAASMGSNGRQAVVREFSWKEEKEKLEELYSRIAMRKVESLG